MSTIFPELPTKLGIYSLTQLLGVREHSELYIAKQSYVEREVVFEVLRPGSSDEVEAVFQETARRRAAVNLPHVSPVLESAQMGRLRYLIQEQPQGKPLARRLAEDGPLSVEQVFSLAQSMADVYGACAAQGVPAAPLSLDAIYMDAESFGFFSPVVIGEASDALRVAQMEGLARILEEALPDKTLAKSKISIIIHWLRHGYENRPLEWALLASSLRKLRSQKESMRRGALNWAELLHPAALWQQARRMVQAAQENAAFLFAALFVALCSAGAAVWMLLADSSVTLPAVSENYVYCKSQDETARVQVRLVNVKEYGKFLRAWHKMNAEQQAELHAGMPEGVDDDHTPEEWVEQNKGDRSLPVRGVSYWDALAYARFVGGRLPTWGQVHAARAETAPPALQEWTSSCCKTIFPLEDIRLVHSVQGESPLQEKNADAKLQQRGFRVAFDHF